MAPGLSALDPDTWRPGDADDLTPSKLKIPAPLPSKWRDAPGASADKVPPMDQNSSDVEEVPPPSSAPAVNWRPKLSAHRRILESQQKWTEQQQKLSQRRTRRSVPTDSDNKLKPETEKAKHETPVPLPNTVQHIFATALSGDSGIKLSRRASGLHFQVEDSHELLGWDHEALQQAVEQTESSLHGFGEAVASEETLHRPNLPESAPDRPMKLNFGAEDDSIDNEEKKGEANSGTNVHEPTAPPASNTGLTNAFHDDDRTSSDSEQALSLQDGSSTEFDQDIPAFSAGFRPSDSIAAKSGEILLTLDGRPYSKFTGDGNPRIVASALFPEGYSLYSDPEYPVICPIRTCRRIFPKLASLAGHLPTAHKGKTLNDNRDGTFTEVGTYPGKRCIVISQERMTDAPPLAVPELSQAWAMKKRASENKTRGINKQTRHGLGSNPAYASVDSPGSTATASTTSTRRKRSQIQASEASVSVAIRKRRRIVSSEESHDSQDANEATLRNGSRLQTRQDKASVSAGSMPPQPGASDVEMEDWEIAPGRLVDTKSRQNEAYSAPFLATSVPIMIMPDIFVNVQTIKPGQFIQMEAERDQCRVCTVAQGKVKVTHGQNSWSVGVNGAFPMRPGEAYALQNKTYFDTVLHCTTVKGYAFSNDED